MGDYDIIVGAVPEQGIVTVLSIDTVGSTALTADFEPGEVQALSDQILRHVRNAVEKHGGNLLSFDGDGGIAVFGWPDSHEDHADQACRSAILLQQAPPNPSDHLPGTTGTIRFRIGIHSGLVIFRRLDLFSGSRLDVSGPPVSLAVKLQNSAEAGTILVSATTLNLCRAKPLTDMKAPEAATKLTPLAISRLLGPHERSPSTAVGNAAVDGIVGREETLARIDAQQKRSSRPYSLTIAGDPGIGKSHLASALIREWVDGNDAAVLLAYFGEQQYRSTPYHGIRSLILQALASATPAAGNPEDALHALDLPTETLNIVAPIIDPGGRHRQDDAPNANSLSDALAGLVHSALSASDCIVYVDDFQWVDGESRACLKKLAEFDAPNWKIILTTRPEAKPAATEITTNVETLEPLDRSEMFDLARQTYPQTPFDDLNLSGAIARSEGNPFVLVQMLAVLLENPGEKDVKLPVGIQSIIHARLNLLTAPAKSLAQILSILGEKSTLELARLTLERAGADIIEHLAELEQSGLIQTLKDGAFRFAHSIIAESCFTTLPKQRRAQLHGFAFAAIESLYPDDSSQFERLAYHAQNADDDAQALEYYWRAGVNARRTAASASLGAIFDAALRCIERIGAKAEPRYVDFVLLTCALLIQRGEFDAVKVHLDTATRLVESQNRPAKHCAALAQAAMFSWFEGRYEEGIHQARLALDMAEKLDRLPTIFAAKIMYACNCFCTGQTVKAIELAGQLVDMLSDGLKDQRLGSTGIASAVAHAFLGWFLTENGQFESGRKHAAEALVSGLRHDDPYSEILARDALGWNALLIGRNEPAVRFLDDALRLADKFGYDAIKPHLVGRLAMALARAGQAARGARIARDCLSSSLPSRTGQLELYYLRAGYAEALVGTGAFEAGVIELDIATTLARKINSPSLIAHGLGVRANFLEAIDANHPELAGLRRERLRLHRQFALIT